jgi:hypothetical protein
MKCINYQANFCLFSLRYFRSEDRTIHERSYPKLHYPEIYLLEGGYKAFYEYSKVKICVLSGEKKVFLFD